MSRRKSFILNTPFLLLVFAVFALAQDPAVVAPNAYKVLLENEHVRVLELTLPPGKSDTMHTHPLAFTYYISGGEVRLTSPDGSIRTATLKDGGHFWQEPTTHMVENIGETTIRVVAFEIRSAIGAEVDLKHKPEDVAPNENTLLIDNEHIRVVETITTPGGGGTLHDHINMVVYGLTTSELEITPEGGEARQVKLPAGAAEWLPGPTLHYVKNIGEMTSHLLHVEVK